MLVKRKVPVESDCNCWIMADDGRANESMCRDELNRKVCGWMVRGGRTWWAFTMGADTIVILLAI